MCSVAILKIGHCSAGVSKKLAIISSGFDDQVLIDRRKIFMLEVVAVFLVVFGVISMLTSYSAASFLSAVIIVALLMLLSSAVRKTN